MILPPNSIIAAGPVIIENGKVLLNRENKNGELQPWFFPGGTMDDTDATIEDACRREVKEEMGIEIEIIKPLKPILLKKADRYIILVHYLAKRIGEIAPGAETADWGWHDINNLPNDCAPNVYEIIKTMT